MVRRRKKQLSRAEMLGIKFFVEVDNKKRRISEKEFIRRRKRFGG